MFSSPTDALAALASVDFILGVVAHKAMRGKLTQKHLLERASKALDGLEFAPIGAGNSKTQTCGTYRNIDESCPACPYKGNGCYAQQNYVNISQRRARDKTLKTHLNTVALALSVAAACKERARLHVSGDFGENGELDLAYLEGVEAVAREVRAAFNVPENVFIGWSYTHFPESVFRGWEERLRAVGIGVRYSDKAGVNGAVVRRFDGLPSHIDGVRVVKCPAQTSSDFTCAQCKICASGKNIVAFDPHGAGAKKLGVA